MEKEKTVRVGIIGIGNMGRAHVGNIIKGKVPGLSLAALADIRPAVKAEFPELAFFATGSELIHSGTVDAVIIATPHYDHTTLGIETLEAGLHLLVEKPISVHKSDCERLIAAHTNPDQVFAAMFNQRTDPKYIKLKELIDSGQLGEIRRIQWTITNWFRTDYYYSSGGWRATWAGEGGGVLLNQCPHQLDLWQWLFGMPDQVRADIRIGRFHDIEVEDDVTAVLKYKDGKTGVFITTTGEAPGTNRLEIAAERGRVVLEGNDISWDRNEVTSSEFCRTATTGFAVPDTWKIQIPFEDKGEQHVGIMKDFARAILSKTPVIAPAAEGIHSIELANAMLLSGFEDRTVSLPLDAGAYEAILKKKIETSTFVKTAVETTAPAADFAKSF
jgi:predicted dehydrogenase